MLGQYFSLITKSLSRWLRPQDMLYTLTRSLTREPIGLEVWMRTGDEYSTLNERCLRYESVTSCHVGFWYHQVTNSTKSLSTLVHSCPCVIFSFLVFEHAQTFFNTCLLTFSSIFATSKLFLIFSFQILSLKIYVHSSIKVFAFSLLSSFYYDLF